MQASWKESQAKVDARSDQLGIPRRFRPSIKQCEWLLGGLNMVKEFRAEMRRTAYAQIAAMKQERIEELERKSANIQLEIAANGIVSPEV